MSVFKNILIVDDNPGDQRLICHLFKKSGVSFSPVYVSSLEEAREKLRTKTFHLLILADISSKKNDYDIVYLLIPDIQETQSSDCRIMMICSEETVIETGKFLGAHWGFTKDILKNDVKFTSRLFNRKKVLSENSVLEPMPICQP